MGCCHSCSHCYGKENTATTGESEHYYVDTGLPSSPLVVKATVLNVKAYKDESLYETMRECRDVRKSLRRVQDPEVTRREKKSRLALQNVRYKVKGGRDPEGTATDGGGYLGMTPGGLQDARKSLRKQGTA
mmetsp:Transcript_12660/g.26694  ORF Transcript_12660/g.26694 Transcript_12660/m.26694 type:complete len:131 (-) Transcript_12660:362-754(-)